MDDDFAGKVAMRAFKSVGRAMGAGVLTGVFDDHKGRDVVVPSDLHLAKLPPVAADGTAECWRCQQRIPYATLDIVDNAYVCGPCSVRTALVDAKPVDVENVKIGHGRWWIMPSVVAVAAAIVAVLLWVGSR